MAYAHDEHPKPNKLVQVELTDPAKVPLPFSELVIDFLGFGFAVLEARSYACLPQDILSRFSCRVRCLGEGVKNCLPFVNVALILLENECLLSY